MGDDKFDYSKLVSISRNMGEKVSEFAKSIKHPSSSMPNLLEIPHYSVEDIVFDFPPNPLIELSEKQLAEQIQMNKMILELSKRLDLLELENKKLAAKNRQFQWILGISMAVITALVTGFFDFLFNFLAILL